jgi:hypothetical protein
MANLILITCVKGKGIVSDTGRVANAAAVSIGFNPQYIKNLKVTTVNGGTGSSFDYYAPGQEFADHYESNMIVADIVTAANA